MNRNKIPAKLSTVRVGLSRVSVGGIGGGGGADGGGDGHGFDQAAGYAPDLG